MREKKPIDPARLRRPPPEGFSWIDRRFVRSGFLRSLPPNAAFLYFFLAAVSDRDGLSFYGDKTVSELLSFAPGELESARSLLVGSALILFRAPLYQVLALPPAAPQHVRAQRRSARRASEPLSVAEILAEAMRRAGSSDSRK